MIIFKNKGLIDLRALKTFGVSSKEKENPIGFFGTGLKYAIAILLREGQEVTLYRGLDKFSFTTRTTKVRVDHFDFITMNGEELAYTLDLGKTWELWQAFRELYCNTMDEDGKVFEAPAYACQEDHTVIVVKGKKFDQVYKERDSIILNRGKPYVEDSITECFEGLSNDIFLQGIRVGKLQKTSIFTYNFKSSLELTEDRTVKYPWEAEVYVKDLIARSDNDPFVHKALTAQETTFEDNINFSDVTTFSDTFFNVAKELERDYSRNVNKSIRNFLLKQVKIREEVRSEPLSAIQYKQYKKALKFCKELGYPIEEYPVIFQITLGKGVFALAERGKMYISFDCFEWGTKTLAAALIEEYIHLKHGLADNTTEMQNHLFNKIVSLGEQLRGEPL